MNISVIMPVLNEAGANASAFERCLQQLQPYRRNGHELIVVDGRSDDDTLEIAQRFADAVIIGERGRALQMNTGAQHAAGDILMFLHADTQLPAQALIAATRKIYEGHYWGRFDIRLADSHFMFRIIERMMNLRSCLTGIATGDQAIFVRRDIFEQTGGFPLQPLMEDIELSRRLRGKGWPACIKLKAVTSSRRWRRYGIVHTVLLMWRLRLAYFFGASPERLAAQYRHG